jgi:hypothetical protein
MERIRAHIGGLFAAADRPFTEVLEDVGRLSVRLLTQTAVEAEVEAFLSRARYERRGDDGPAGYRNGYQPPATVKTTMGRWSCSARSCETPTSGSFAAVRRWRDPNERVGGACDLRLSRICQSIRGEFATARRLDDVTLFGPSLHAGFMMVRVVCPTPIVTTMALKVRVAPVHTS